MENSVCSIDHLVTASIGRVTVLIKTKLYAPINYTNQKTFPLTIATIPGCLYFASISSGFS